MSSFYASIETGSFGSSSSLPRSLPSFDLASLAASAPASASASMSTLVSSSSSSRDLASTTLVSNRVALFEAMASTAAVPSTPKTKKIADRLPTPSAASSRSLFLQIQQAPTPATPVTSKVKPSRLLAAPRKVQYHILPEPTREEELQDIAAGFEGLLVQMETMKVIKGDEAVKMQEQKEEAERLSLSASDFALALRRISAKMEDLLDAREAEEKQEASASFDLSLPSLDLEEEEEGLFPRDSTSLLLKLADELEASEEEEMEEEKEQEKEIVSVVLLAEEQAAMPTPVAASSEPAPEAPPKFTREQLREWGVYEEDDEIFICPIKVEAKEVEVEVSSSDDAADADPAPALCLTMLETITEEEEPDEMGEDVDAAHSLRLPLDLGSASFEKIRWWWKPWMADAPCKIPRPCSQHFPPLTARVRSFAALAEHSKLPRRREWLSSSSSPSSPLLTQVPASPAFFIVDVCSRSDPLPIPSAAHIEPKVESTSTMKKVRNATRGYMRSTLSSLARAGKKQDAGAAKKAKPARTSISAPSSLAVRSKKAEEVIATTRWNSSATDPALCQFRTRRFNQLG